MIKSVSRYLFALMAAALSLASCSSGDVASVIPADAKIVAEIDLSRISDKAGLNIATLQEQMENIADGKSSVIGKISDFAENPLVLSLVMKDELYAFTTSDYVGFAAHLRGKKLAEGLFSLLEKKGECTSVEEKKGYSWTIYKGQWMVAFDDDRLFAMGPVGPSLQQPLRNEMLRMLSQDDDESFAANDNFARLQAQNSDIALYSTLAGVPEFLQGQFASAQPEGVTADKLQLLMTVDFKNTGIEIKGQTFSDDENIQKQIDAQDAKMHPLEGTYAGMIPADGFVAWGATSMEGDELLKSLKKNKLTSAVLMGLNAGIDADAVVRAVNGDAAFCVSRLKADGAPDFAFYATVANTDFLADVDYWRKSVAELGGGASLTPNGNNDYSLRMTDFNGRFGVDGKMFYATNCAGMKMKPAFSDSVGGFSLKDCCSFMIIDVDKVVRTEGVAEALKVAENYVAAAPRLLASLKTVVMKVGNAHSGEVLLNTKESKENILKKLLK